MARGGGGRHFQQPHWPATLSPEQKCYVSLQLSNKSHFFSPVSPQHVGGKPQPLSSQNGSYLISSDRINASSSQEPTHQMGFTGSSLEHREEEKKLWQIRFLFFFSFTLHRDFNNQCFWNVLQLIIVKKNHGSSAQSFNR